MSGFQPKRYQQSVLDSVEAYFRACHQYGPPTHPNPPPREGRVFLYSLLDPPEQPPGEPQDEYYRG